MSRGPRRIGTTRSAEDRAVSDVVAFTFTFSIIITSVGVVSAVGFSVLEDVQNDEQALNAQRGFQSLGTNLNEIDRTHAPGRSGEISLNDGALFVRDEDDSPVSAFDISVINAPPGAKSSWSIDAGTVFYESQGDDTRVALESGAVIRKDKLADQGVIVQRPNVVCGSNYAIVSIVKVTSDETTLGGDGTVQIVGRQQSTRLLYGNSTTTGVTVTYDGRFPRAWEDYFDRSDWTIVSSGSSTVTAECTSIGTVIVRRTVVDIDFVG